MTAGRRAALVLVVLGCTRSAPPRPPGPIVSTLVALDAQLGTDAATAAAAFADLEDIARRVEQRHRRTRGDIADDLAAVLFGELGFAREIESTDPRFYRLSSVLRDRRGSCLGLADLYLAVAERLGVALDGVLLPGHFFVRTRGPGQHNVELLRRGEAMPDDWYLAKYGPWPGGDGSAYFRPITPTELAAIHWYNRGNDLRSKGELVGAEAAFARAAHDFPAFAEAHASLGAVKQLRGDEVGADACYREAARRWPGLPGLDRNLELLRRPPAPAPP